MKKYLLALLLLGTVTAAGAQKIVIGERAPDIKIKEWLTAKPTDGGARLVAFFHTSSKESAENLATLDTYAGKYGKLTVVVVAREDKDEVLGILLPSPRRYHAGLDDGTKTFEAYGVQYVPYGVLTDTRGRVVWFGNTTALREELIAETAK